MFAIFDACDDDALVQGEFVSYNQADQVAAALRAQGGRGIFACQVCPDHEDEPAADCQRCGEDPDED